MIKQTCLALVRGLFVKHRLNEENNNDVIMTKPCWLESNIKEILSVWSTCNLWSCDGRGVGREQRQKCVTVKLC